jgi:hypothetical protein
MRQTVATRKFATSLLEHGKVQKEFVDKIFTCGMVFVICSSMLTAADLLLDYKTHRDIV